MSLESLVANGLSELQCARYASVAAGVIIIYDHLTTLDQEIELIWKTRCSIVKYLFFLNRYYLLCCVVFNNYALFTMSLTDSLCVTSYALLASTYLCTGLHWFRWQGWTGLAACMIAEVILQMRLYALYLQNKKILAFMFICFGASSLCSGIIMGTVLSRMTAISELIPGKMFCIPLNVSPHLYFFWIPILIFESLLGVLALVRGIQTARSDQGIFHFGRDLVNILIRDSILYFLVIVATYLTNLVVWATQSEYLIEIPITFAVAMSCVMGNRIILNVRGARLELESASKDSGGTLDFLPHHPHHQHMPASPMSINFTDPVVPRDEEWELQSLQAVAV